MDGRPAAFDALTAFLDWHAHERGDDIAMACADDSAAVRQPFLKWIERYPSTAQAIDALDASFDLTEARFRALAETSSFDYWILLLRRFPLSPFPVNWARTLTIALLKHSSTDSESRFLETLAEGKALMTVVTEGDMLAAHRLARLAAQMSALVGVRRWVGKGARLRPTADNPTAFHASETLSEAVSLYERRRSSELFRERGIMLDPGDYNDGMVLTLSSLPLPVHYRTPIDDLRLLANYLPHAMPLNALWRALEPYRAAIEYRYNIKMEIIGHFLGALARRTLTTVLPFDADDEGLLIKKGTVPTDELEYRLRFTFELFQRGFLRKPSSDWVNDLGVVRSQWAPNDAAARDVVSQFLDRFAVDQSRAASLDLRSLIGYPFCVTTPIGQYYVDLAGIYPWLLGIAADAQEWLASQHGDHFHLAVTKFLQRTLGSETVRARWSFETENGQIIMADLAVLTDAAVYCVECKGFRKGDPYMRGDPNAIASRTTMLRRAIRQAKRAAEAVAEGRSPDITSGGRPVVAVVCTPSPEFVHPVDRFGMLDQSVPVVCTPEELVHAISRLTDNGVKNTI